MEPEGRWPGPRDRERPERELLHRRGFGTVNSQARKRLAQVTPAGAVTPWSVNVGQVSGFACPPRCKPTVYTIGFSTDGQTVFFGGHFGLVNGVTRNEVAAVPINERRDRAGLGSRRLRGRQLPDVHDAETARVYHLIITANKAYMCGGFWKVWHGTRRAYNVLVTNLTTGQPDPVYSAGNDGDTPGCALRGNVLYFGGHFNYVGKICSQNPGGGSTKCTVDNATTRHHVAAVDATTGAILPWDANANSNHGIWAIETGPNGQMAFMGYFTRIGGSKQQMIAKYSAVPSDLIRAQAGRTVGPPGPRVSSVDLAAARSPATSMMPGCSTSPPWSRGSTTSSARPSSTRRVPSSSWPAPARARRGRSRTGSPT